MIQNIGRTIFRAKALEQYLHGREAHVVVRLISSQALLLLWISFSLLAIAGVILTFWAAPIP